MINICNECNKIEHGILQLETTINRCKEFHNRVKSKQCYIVASRVPKSDANSQSLQRKFKKSNGIQLFIDTVIKKVNI